MKVLVNEKQRFNRELMTKIWQSIEREAMLETQPVSAPERSAVAIATADDVAATADVPVDDDAVAAPAKKQTVLRE
ncbi:MAG: hypothetical protein GY842_12190 [bacterium]|nr:hypothetical protein [bacterium]